MTFNLTCLSLADLAYLEHVVSAGRVLRRSKSKPTQFAKTWLRDYADEHAGVVYLKKEQRLKYYWLENDVDQLCLD